MDKPECDSAYERLLAMLTRLRAQGAVLSAWLQCSAAFSHSILW